MVVSDPEEPENDDGRAWSTTISQAKVGTAEFIIQVEERRSIKVFGSDKLLGIGLVFLSAVCASLCFAASNLATNDQWHTLRNGTQHLVVYTVFFYFSVSCFVLELCLNVWFLYQPRVGVPASTIGAYTKDWKGRNWALLAGLLCGFGNGFKLMGGQAAGYAASDAVLVLFSWLNIIDSLQTKLTCTITMKFLLLSMIRHCHLSAQSGQSCSLANTGDHQGEHTCCSLACCSCSPSPLQL